MNIVIEDYFGNDVLKLDFQLRDKVITDGNIKAVGILSSICGYDVADVDCDDNDMDYIRLQQVNVDNSEEEGRKDLLLLINKLTKHFI